MKPIQVKNGNDDKKIQSIGELLIVTCFILQNKLQICIWWIHHPL